MNCMTAVLGMAALKVNGAVDLRIGGACFVGIVESVESDAGTVLMDGSVRVGSGVGLSQEDVNLVGRVKACSSLADGGGFQLTISLVNHPELWVQGFEWSDHNLTHLAATS
jgi:hypothetical protein